ncbi:MAG TPA: hypothetical protein P5060_03665 [Candidatus Absconditabacterales bacterium]|nr:hypothetical protein [Candidatus Absconditabacterales bacterium]
MPAKKTVKKTVAKKSDFEKKFDDVKKNTKTTAKKVETESKKIMTGVGSWWTKASDEEKIYMVLGIILLLIGLYVLRTIVGGLLLIIVGILFVTGFFVKNKK